jgi:DNA invertase Pin-like site-specific DNA recombinase
MAEFERALIQERVKAGIRNARAKGKRLGRPSKKVDAATVAGLRSQGASWRATPIEGSAFQNPGRGLGRSSHALAYFGELRSETM